VNPNLFTFDAGSVGGRSGTTEKAEGKGFFGVMLIKLLPGASSGPPSKKL